MWALPKDLKEKFEVIQAVKGCCVPGSGSSRFEDMKIKRNGMNSWTMYCGLAGAEERDRN